MKLNMVIAAASMLACGVASAGVAAYPGDSLGVLSPSPALYGDLLSTDMATGGGFRDGFSFELATRSDVWGSVGAFFGTVSYSSVQIDGQALLLNATPTAYGFSFSGLAAGAHTLTVEGSFPQGRHAYIGSLYATPAVPEPEAVALALTGLGLMGMGLCRRQRIER